MIVGVDMFYTAVIFITGLNLITCAEWSQSWPVFSQNQEGNSELLRSRGELVLSRTPYVTNYKESPPSPKIVAAPSSKIQEQSDRLPWNRFTQQVSDLLSPEMFTQTDPILYLMEKTVKLPYSKIFSLDDTLRQFSYNKNKFPPRYVPYATFLTQLVRCQNHLEQARRNIVEIGDLLNSGSLSLPFDGDSLIKMFGLISDEIFSDPNPPFRLLKRLMKMSEDEIADLKGQLANFLRNERLPGQYYWYAKELETFVMSKFDLKRLKQSSAELQAVSMASSSKASDQSTEKARLVSTKVPLFAA